MTLEQAKATVRALLDAAGDDADKVYRALAAAQRVSRRGASYSEADRDDYAMQRLALADITGNAAYRQ